MAHLPREKHLGGPCIFGFALEAAKELAENASDAPHVDFGVVLLLKQNDFGCSVPPRLHMV